MSLDTQEVFSPANSNQEISVSIKFGDVKADFTGNVEAVIRSVNSFFAKEIPSYAIARKLLLSYDAADLVENFADYVKMTSEGPVVLTGDKKLSDRHLVALRLVAQEIAFRTGAVESSSISLSELQESLTLNPKTISSRLSDLSKLGNVIRTNQAGSSTFKITTLGINSLIDGLNKRDRK
jgi:predicted transcriptional regulator